MTLLVITNYVAPKPYSNNGAKTETLRDFLKESIKAMAKSFSTFHLMLTDKQKSAVYEALNKDIKKPSYYKYIL